MIHPVQVPTMTLPKTMIAAVVAQMKEGDRVGAPCLHTACRCCEHCNGGWETLCESRQNTGHSADGAYADDVAADANYGGFPLSGIYFGRNTMHLIG